MLFAQQPVILDYFTILYFFSLSGGFVLEVFYIGTGQTMYSQNKIIKIGTHGIFWSRASLPLRC